MYIYQVEWIITLPKLGKSKWNMWTIIFIIPFWSNQECQFIKKSLEGLFFATTDYNSVLRKILPWNDMWPTPRFGHDWVGDQCRQCCQTIVFGRLKRYTTHERRSYYSNSTTNGYNFFESNIPPIWGFSVPFTHRAIVESKWNWKSAQTYTNSALKNVLTDIKHLNKTLIF